MGKGNEGIVEVEFDLIAATVVANQALVEEFSQGGTDGRGAQAAELAQALHGGGFLQVSQDAANPLSSRHTWRIGHDVCGRNQSQGRTGLA